MGLLKYTTEVTAARSVSEIFSILQAAGAESIMLEYDSSKQPSGIGFVIKTHQGPMSFKMAVEIRNIEQILKNQVMRRMVPRSVLREGQAARIGWRIVKDWLEAQLALIEIGLVTLDQIFLPYAVTNQGQTVYQILTEEGRMTKLLAAGGPQ